MKNKFLSLNKSTVWRRTVFYYIALVIYALTVLQDKEAYTDFSHWRNSLNTGYPDHIIVRDCNLLGLYNLFLTDGRFSSRYEDNDGINLRELVFILGILSMYIASSIRVDSIRVSNKESNYPFKGKWLRISNRLKLEKINFNQ